jgi:hypothetical protein
LGLDAEAPRVYCSFAINSLGTLDEIGVISSGVSSDVAALLHADSQRIVVGHDTRVTWIDGKGGAVASSRPLGSAFFEFIAVERDNEIVVLHELGAIRIDLAGSTKWSVDTDVVEESRIDAAGNLVLKTMDGPTLVVSMTSGVVLKKT